MGSSIGDTVTAIPSSTDSSLIEDTSSLAVSDPATVASQENPSHLSHSSQTDLKRTDPFQFGSRLLSEEDNVFEHNAWDHVETDDTYKEYAELQYAKQREAPVSEFDKSKHSPTLPHFFTLLMHPDDSKQCIVHLRLLAHE